MRCARRVSSSTPRTSACPAQLLTNSWNVASWFIVVFFLCRCCLVQVQLYSSETCWNHVVVRHDCLVRILIPVHAKLFTYDDFEILICGNVAFVNTLWSENPQVPIVVFARTAPVYLVCRHLNTFSYFDWIDPIVDSNNNSYTENLVWGFETTVVVVSAAASNSLLLYPSYFLLSLTLIYISLPSPTQINPPGIKDKLI